MLPLFATQLYALLVLLICGTKLLQLAGRHISAVNNNYSFFEIVIAGCISLTIYAQLLAFVLPCNLITLLPFSLACLYKNNLLKNILLQLNFKFTYTQWAIGLFVLISFLLLNYYPTHNPDTMGYHAQMVDIFNKYKLIPGLANLYSRAGFNNNNFLINAFFAGQYRPVFAAYAINCWVGLAFIIWLVKLMLTKANFIFAAAGFIILFFALRNVVLNFRSPSPDLLVSTISLFVIINLCLEYFNHYKNIKKFNWLLLLSIYAITVKLSAVFGAFSLLVCYLFYFKKHTAAIFKFTALACLILVIPWLVRSVYLSGFLLYPYIKFPAQLAFTVPQYLVRHENLPAFFQYYTSVEMQDTVARPGILTLFKQWYITQWTTPFNLATLLFSVATIFTPLVVLYAYTKKLIGNYILVLYTVSFVSIIAWLLGNCEYRFGTHLLLILLFISLLPFYNYNFKFKHKTLISIGCVACMLYYFYYNYNYYKPYTKTHWLTHTYKTIYHQQLPQTKQPGTVVLTDASGTTVQIAPKGFDQIQVPEIFSIEQKKPFKLSLIGLLITHGIKAEDK
jgi:hypothetical protein